MRILKGLSALLVLLLLLIGLPIALAYLGGNPATAVPAWDQAQQVLTSRDDGTILVWVLTVAGWIGWAAFAASTLLEVSARVRRVPVPRVPTLSVPQAGAHLLIGAVLAMATLASPLTAAATDAPAATTSTSVNPAATASATYVASTTGSTGIHTPAAQDRDRDSESAQVEPGDTLSGIAADHLGDPARYPDIAAANPDLIQDPNLIYPGDELTIPADTTTDVDAGTGKEAATDEAVTVERGDTLSGIAADHLGDPARYPDIAAANPDLIQDPNLIYPGDELTIPGSDADTSGSERAAPEATNPETTTPPLVTGGLSTTGDLDTSAGAAQGDRITKDLGAPTAPSPGTTVTPPAATNLTETTASGQDSQISAAYVLTGIATLSAAGALGLLAARRASQSRRRRPGRRIAMPTGKAAALETTLRTTSDPLAATDLDHALRSLAAWAHHTHTTMPAIRAARITVDELELYLVDDRHTPPTPFTNAGDGTWVLHRDHLTDLSNAEDLEDIPAPCPSLVTLGADDLGGLILVNLEEVGSLAVTGTDPAQRQAVLAALALELVGSSWADDLRLTMVGTMPDLADALGSDRVDYVPSLDRVLAGVLHASDVHTRTLTATGQASATTARGAMVATETWTPHLILLGTDPTPAQAEQLREVLHTTPRLAVATITTDTHLSPWQLHLTGDRQATLDPAGVALSPQMIDEHDYAALISAFTTTEADDIDGPSWAQTVAPESTVGPTHTPTPQLPKADVDLPTATLLVLPTPENDTALEGEDLVQVDSEDVDDQDDDSAAASNSEQTPVEPPEDDLKPSEPEPELVIETAELEDPDEPEQQLVDEYESDALAGDISEHQEEASEEPATSAEVAPVSMPGPVVRLLGPVEVQRPLGKRPMSPGRTTELIAFLALHPSDSYEPLDAAMWPGERIHAKKRNPAVSQARNWLGDNPDGVPYVAYVEDGGYRLDGATIDWHVFQNLLGDDIAAANTTALHQALKLVEGQPLTVKGLYAWAEVDRQEMIASIADVAHELSTRALASGDARTAGWAAAKGTTVEPASELLWRDQLRAAWLSAIPGKVDTVARQLTDTLEPIGGDLDPDTIELLHQLLTDQPGHRASHA